VLFIKVTLLKQPPTFLIKWCNPTERSWTGT